jgi:hypothetical protein
MVQGKQNGFVFNFFGGSETQGYMNVIHRVDCRHLWRASDEGRRTTTYAKVCSRSLIKLTEFVIGERRLEWKYCKTCKPKTIV